ncbi:MAG TPA: sugar-transfer associated ATP-grasp domain-containing protein [Gemmatimonadales bacterium]|nr:sugar-transfer associated ATP-grasp domain-containing protein [Gemmatimonadales bacterium]
MSVQGVRRFASDIAWVRRERGVGFRAQWREFRRFQAGTGITRGEFLRYWLWDVDRPIGQRMAIMSRRERLAAEQLMNPVEHRPLLQNKNWVDARLQAAGLRTSTTLALIGKWVDQPGRSTDARLLTTPEEIRSLLSDAPSNGVVFKPLFGDCGDSVLVFRAADAAQLIAFDGTVWPIERLLLVLETEAELWKVEARIPQHPVLASVAGETLGTLRMLAFTMLDGSTHLAPTTWKIATDDSGLDHFMHGAMRYAAPVHPDTGVVGPARRWASLQAVDTHPVTGAGITGLVIPWWEEAKEMVKAAAACFPMVWAPAFDVAISEEGPVIIELNLGWAEPLTQAPGPRGLVSGRFREFLEERGCGNVVNLAARDRTALRGY